MGMLRDLARAKTIVEQALVAWSPTLRALGADVPSADAIIEQLRRSRDASSRSSATRPAS